MADNALTLIQAKIAETEAKLAKLRTTEKELSKLTGAATTRLTPSTTSRRGRPRKDPSAVAHSVATIPDSTKQTVADQIRGYLRANGPVTMPTIKEALGLDGRPVSFTLQALKRAGEAKKVGNEWSMKGRRKVA